MIQVTNNISIARGVTSQLKRLCRKRKPRNLKGMTISRRGGWSAIRVESGLMSKTLIGTVSVIVPVGGKSIEIASSAQPQGVPIQKLIQITDEADGPLCVCVCPIYKIRRK